MNKFDMDEIRTYKVKIQIPSERVPDVEKLFRSVQEIFNIHTQWAFCNRTYSKRTAHKELYDKLKEQYPDLPVQYIQSTRDQALEAVKRIVKHQKESRKWSGKIPRKKLWSAVRLVNGCTISYFPNSEKVTFSCYGKRLSIPLKLSEYFKTKTKNLIFHSAQLKRDRQKTFWLYLQFKVQVPDTCVLEPKVLGIDFGVYNIVALSNGTLINAKEFKRIKRKYQYLRQKLQAKGTRSAKRLLRKISGKESRFSYSFCHKLTKLISELDYNVVVVEDLSLLKESKSKSKKANRMINSYMPYGVLTTLLEYKLREKGKLLVKVNPKNTSRRCSVCGSLNTNRYKSKFKCLDCGYSKHADVNAAINIRDIFLSSLYGTDRQGAVNRPYVSDSSPGTSLESLSL